MGYYEATLHPQCTPIRSNKKRSRHFIISQNEDSAIKRKEAEVSIGDRNGDTIRPYDKLYSIISTKK